MCRQTVTHSRRGTIVEFLEGETIWTESSHKYSPEEISPWLRNAGFRCEAQWIDEQWPFAENAADRGVIVSHSVDNRASLQPVHVKASVLSSYPFTCFVQQVHFLEVKLCKSVGFVPSRVVN